MNMMSPLDQVQGCILGLALGDALGAPYEGGIVEKTLWRLIGKTRHGEMRWTDDTQMSIDVIESFLATGRMDPDDLAGRFSKSYRWSRGYGPGTAKVLKRIASGTDWRTASRSVYADGSFGNGAAMRAPSIGVVFAHRPAELSEAVHQSAIVTHAHPIGIEGASLMARVTADVLCGKPSSMIVNELPAHIVHDDFASRFATARKWLECGDDVSTRDVARRLGNGIAAHQSCVTAIYLALRFRDQSFALMQEFVVRVGGDTDTIGAMSGAIWGTANGYSQLPTKQLTALEQNDRLMDLATKLHQRIIPPHIVPA